MKRIVLFTCIILLAVNALLGLLLTGYEDFNVFLCSGVIVLSGIFMLLIEALPLKDGFQSSLYVVYPILGLVELILSQFSPDRLTDNRVLVVLILMVVFQLIFLFIVHVISKRIR